MILWRRVIVFQPTLAAESILNKAVLFFLNQELGLLEYAATLLQLVLCMF